MRKKVLCIEDDATIQTLVEVALPDYELVCASTLGEAKSLLAKVDFCAMVIDIQLPDGDGLRFLTQIHKEDKAKRIPVLILSSHTEISNKVMAFSYGADDFVGKPFDPIELNARLSAKVRKSTNEDEESQLRRFGNLLLDFFRQKAFRMTNGIEQDLGLTSIELKILSLLTKRTEQVYSREQIMNQVWGDTFIADRTVDSHIAHLRQKIDGTPVEIVTAKNFGYRAVVKK